MDKEMEDICKSLEGRGFTLQSQKGYRIQIYTKGYICVVVEDKEIEQDL